MSIQICEWIYIISISFQLSGAVLLLIKYSFVNIEKGILEKQKKETHVEGENLIMGSTQPTDSEYAENVWSNRVAFAWIAAGYLLGVWGDIRCEKRIIAFFLVIVASAAITTLSVLITKRLNVTRTT